MTNLALYRKWRSKNFDELKGQPHITQTLSNAVLSGKTTHAYLFCGPRGTGKTSAAKILAKALNCEKGPTPNPCNECAICQGITQGSILDCIEIDAASNRGIDEIRDLREKVKFAPTQCRTKVYIIDEVHMLTSEAFNALLKTLEEPPPNTVFILCTTEPHKLLPTVTSRCQRFDFKRISTKVIQERLQEICQTEEIQVDATVLSMIAQNSEGSLRDAVSLLDQLHSFCQGRISHEAATSFLGHTPQATRTKMIELIQKGDLKDLLVGLHEILSGGSDLSQLIKDLLFDFRKTLLFKIARDIEEFSEEQKAFFEKISQLFLVEELYRILRVLADLRQELRHSPHPQLSCEVAFMHILKPQWEPTLEGLKKRIEQLETTRSNAPTPPLPVSEKPQLTVRQVSQKDSVSLEKIQKEWKDFLETLKNARNPLFAFLQEAKPTRLEKDLLVLAFPFEFHKNRLEQKKEEAQRVLNETFHTTFRVTGEVQTADHDSFVTEATQLFQGAFIVDSVKE